MYKVLILNANRVGIGTYFRALYFGRALAKRGHSVVMMTVSQNSRWRIKVHCDESGMKIIECPNFMDECLPWHASGWLDILIRIKEILTGDYDIVYAFEYQPNISIPVYATRLFKKYRLISDWCDWHAGASYHFGGKKWAHAIDRFFEESIRHRANHLTTINYVLQERGISIGIPPEKITVIREGVDPDYITPLDKIKMREALSLPADTPILGTIVDSLPITKLLMRAVKKVSSKYPTLHFLIIGKVSKDVAAAAEEIGVANQMILPGRVLDMDLPRYLAAADLLALPLEDNLVNRGRWPHKLGDMIAAQRPVLVSIGGEFPALLGERGCAMIVDLDPDAYALAIEEVLTKPKAYEDMAKRGRQLIINELNWTVIGDQVEATLNKVVGGL